MDDICGQIVFYSGVNDKNESTMAKVTKRGVRWHASARTHCLKLNGNRSTHNFWTSFVCLLNLGVEDSSSSLGA